MGLVYVFRFRFSILIDIVLFTFFLLGVFRFLVGLFFLGVGAVFLVGLFSLWIFSGGLGGGISKFKFLLKLVSVVIFLGD